MVNTTSITILFVLFTVIGTILGSPEQIRREIYLNPDCDPNVGSVLPQIVTTDTCLSAGEVSYQVCCILNTKKNINNRIYFFLIKVCR